MSLPPLVCNTPPPPDQCEDDKDPEDFDISYNLSQDDDEDSNSYDYQTYANYNMYETTKPVNIQDSNWSLNIANDLNNVLTDQVIKDNEKTEHIAPIINDLSEKLTLEDVAVEDLNLEISQEQLNPQVNIEKSDIDGSDYNYSPKEKVSDEKTSVNCDIVETDTIIIQNDNSCTTETSENCLPDITVEHCEPISKTYELPEDEFHDFHSNLDPENNETEVQSQSDSDLNFKKEMDDLDEKIPVDDFGDFDDFQFASSDNVSTVIENFENPWTNEAPTNDFGDFKANFDENSDVFHVDNDTSNVSNVDKDICLTNELNNDCGDDFGDFDDFKSCTKSAVKTELDVQIDQHIPVIDFHLPENENQVLENITNIFTSIFEEEISEPESEFIGRLESVLNETWGHLVDMDVRQPYMVNWNNSLGQKSLLKALCIDSRNILFGPKWNYNMPKYAVNLSAAPLQPLKQSTSTLPQMEIQNVDKSVNKETDTWIDPFSSNGQESCNSENDAPATENRPTDLEVFEKVMSAKLDKVYPASLNVQPLRQISLPDTHIFTPSDSETPRSKTIHYDSVSPVLLTQTSNDVAASNVIPSSIDDVAVKLDDDNDYWEFQDFKSTTENIQPSENKDVGKSDVESEKSNVGNSNNIMTSVLPSGSYQPQLLQPIKLEPLVPALNWPNPGEVKDTFDDFSNFVSSAPWENDKNNSANVDVHENKTEVKTIVSNKHNETPFTETTSNVEVESNDDDFETFQSAPTVPQSIKTKPFDSSSQSTYQASSSKSTNFDKAFSEFGKLNTIEVTKAHEMFVKNIPHFTNENHNNSMLSVRDGFATNSPVHSIETSNILQPLPAASTSIPRSQNNTAQILQPLSLESYSQINWPNPGIDLQDLSRFNPVETVPSLKSDLSSNSQSKVNSPAHTEKSAVRNEVLDDDVWGEFVSSKPKQQISAAKKPPAFGDEEEWTEFVSSTSVQPQNGLNTISLNVHTNLSLQKSSKLNKLNVKNNQISLDIPTLNYITPKSSRKTYNDKHFQNL